MRKVPDRAWQVASYAAAISGLLLFWYDQPLPMMGAWILALMMALYRVFFTHDTGYKEDGSQFFLEIFDGLLVTMALVSFIGGLIAIGMSGPVAAAWLWAIGFIGLQLQLVFTLTPKQWYGK